MYTFYFIGIVGLVFVTLAYFYQRESRKRARVKASLTNKIEETSSHLTSWSRKQLTAAYLDSDDLKAHLPKIEQDLWEMLEPDLETIWYKAEDLHARQIAFHGMGGMFESPNHLLAKWIKQPQAEPLSELQKGEWIALMRKQLGILLKKQELEITHAATHATE
ncbi:hypothetical protein [Pontibacter sp. G13]|uniref:hypothetical protein n=1 Tax=Pontibacter sp. G13 TaxID=3074898 RepID=UPI00288AFB6B|nr:hypothetical protein [Pontibacter sp. G13]WNJ16048.1 hypothetical protein RJD25_14390 [Pontibacter sp. G13]